MNKIQAAAAHIIALATLAMVALPGDARAQVSAEVPSNPCDDSQAPSCQQVLAQGTLKADGTTGWALYCPASAQYYWGNYTHKSSRVTSYTENVLAENEPNKADFTITNWSALGSSGWSIAIACSPIAPWGGGCTGPTREVSDPSCPESNRRTTCDGSDNCFLEWDETCVNGNTVTQVFCSQVLFTTTCFSCQ